MNLTEEPRLAPPVCLRNGCGPHTSSPPKQSNENVISPVGKYSNYSSNSPYQKPHRVEQQLNLHDDVMYMFDKCFEYQKPDTTTNAWSLPTAEKLFTEYYQLESLQQLKVKLNDVKSKLNEYIIEEWSQHTRRRDPAGDIPRRLKFEVRGEFVTIAWCKMFECLGRFPQLVKGARLNSLHLCEAPGAFIAALNHFLHSKYDKKEQIQWQWLATTLNPYYEGNPVDKMIMDDRFILFTLDNWLFHKDFTGNLIDNTNLEHMKQQCQQRLGEVHLITADGSIDCINAPDCQEENVAILHYAEILAALEILANGGCFVVKMFTLFEASSVGKLYLLNCAFERVHIFKPCTSKRGNSEIYVVCLNYQKDCKNLKEILEKMKEKLSMDHSLMGPLFPKNCLPADFLMKHEIVCRIFMNYQINAIESNIASYEIKPNKFSIRRLQALKTYVCDEYFRRYKIKQLPEEMTILFKNHGHIEKSYKTQIYHGSHSERQMLKETTAEEQIFKLRQHLNNLEKMMCQPSGEEIEFVKHFNREKENISLKLKIFRGESYEILNSTLFANVHLMVMRNKLNDFHSHDVLWHNDPHVEFESEKILLQFNNANNQSSPKKNIQNFYKQQKLFFVSLMENLMKLKPSSFKFVHMPFVTHYAVSILRYLSLNAYEHLSFEFHPSFEITLKKPSKNFKKSIESIHHIMVESNSEQQDILCFVDILQLHHNDFNKTLISYNKMLLLHKFKSILDN